MTILEFCETIEAHITIRTCSPGARSRWSCSIDGVEIMGDGVLSSSTGWADTPDEAIAAMVATVRGKRIAQGAYTDGRREFVVPASVTP